MPGPTLAPLPTGEVTLLFTDIEGSTPLLGALGAAYADLLNTHNRVLREVWEAHRGVEVKTEGDSFFVAFPDANDAVQAALVGQRELGAQEWPNGVQVRIRMGLHTGRPELLSDERDYWGADVHLAARVGAAAHGGQVLMTERTAKSCGGVEAEDLGRWRLKGFDEPERLLQLVIDGAGADVFPPPRAMDVRPSNLPRATTPLIGRDSVVGQVCGLLSGSSRLVTIIGIGGLGKTRIALAVGDELLEHFRDGVFFADLSAVTDPAAVAEVVAAAVGADAPPDSSLPSAVSERLHDRHLLLIIDNCEHVLDGAAVIGSWLEAAPDLRVLATSQAPLRLRGEQLVTLASLDPQGALRLFVDRARMTDPDFALTDGNEEAVSEICRRLDGSPMAIELAASRCHLLGVTQLARRLEADLLSLGAGPRDAPARQRSLEAAMGWATGLLSGEEQVVFRRWGVFAGRPNLERAVAICAPEAGGVDAIAALVDHSLVRADPDGRLRMPQSVLAYAQRLLVESGEVDDMRRRHAGVMAVTAEAQYDAFMLATEATLVDAALDREDLFAALRWAIDADQGLHARLSANTALPLVVGGSVLLLEAHITAALAARTADPRTHERLVAADGLVAYMRGDRPRERERVEAAIALADELGDARERALLRVVYAKIVSSGDQPGVDPMILLHDALEIARSAELPGFEHLVGGLEVEAHLNAGRNDEAIFAFEHVGVDETVDDFATYSLASNMGDLAYIAGRHREALEHAVEGLRWSVGNAGFVNISWSALDVATFLVAVGDSERGVRLMAAAEAFSERSGVTGRPNFMKERIGERTAEAQRVLGAERYESIFDEGRRLDWDVALGLALRAAVPARAQ